MEWFVGLPLAAQIVLGLAFLIIIFGLAYLGKVYLKFGKNVITFGRQATRSCGDCCLVLLSKRERMEYQRNFILNRVLKEQMNYAEQKLTDVQSLLLTSYRDMISRKRTDEFSSTEENMQYRLYQGLLMNALIAIKDEIRRSFKENGFEHLSPGEFKAYIKDKFATLNALGKDFITNMYPYDGMIVTITDRAENLERLSSKIEEWCIDMFEKARDIKIDAKEKASRCEKDFAKEMDEFVQVNKR